MFLMAVLEICLEGKVLPDSQNHPITNPSLRSATLDSSSAQPCARDLQYEDEYLHFRNTSVPSWSRLRLSALLRTSSKW
jgi:hypothetical protein